MCSKLIRQFEEVYIKIFVKRYYCKETTEKLKMSWLIIGVSGVTNGGKTTLASSLYKYFKDPANCRLLNGRLIVKTVKMFNQDKYFLPIDSPQHVKIEQLNHINWEIMSALDMTQMCKDIQNILGYDFMYYSKEIMDSRPVDEMNIDSCPTIINILIIEGFLIFNYAPLLDLCQLKFHLHIPYEKCFERRKTRSYVPPDVTGYFEMCVWPMYEKHFSEIRDRNDIAVLNGDLPKERLFNYVLNCILNYL